MTFAEAVAAAHDWASANGATVRFTRVNGIDGGDGRVWSSLMVDTKGTAPGLMANQIPDVVDTIRKTAEPFDFTVGD